MGRKNNIREITRRKFPVLVFLPPLTFLHALLCPLGERATFSQFRIFFLEKKLIPISYEIFIVPGSSREATDSEEKVGQGLDFVKNVAFPIFTSRVWEIPITYEHA